jgi:plastocyanin
MMEEFMRKTILSLVAVAAVVASSACSSSSTSSGGGSGAGGGVDAAGGGGAGGSADGGGGGQGGGLDASLDSGPSEVDSSPGAGPELINGCTATEFTSNDLSTAATPTIVGPTTSSPTQYAPNCITIKAGQSVTWTSDFTDHPLDVNGGSTPTPITLTSSGSTVTFAFPSVGTYGYQCDAHPGIMFGAVYVKAD